MEPPPSGLPAPICISFPCPVRAFCMSQNHTSTPHAAFRHLPARLTLPTLPGHRLLKWIEDGIPKDPFLNPDLMKNNPWVEKGKCAIL